MTVSDYIIQFLVDRGSNVCFLLSGNGAMVLDDSIHRKMKYICARNEAAAPVMAKAWAKLTGKLGVVCVTAGPGALNAVPGLGECWVDSTPVLILSGQVPYNVIEPNCRTFGTAGIDIIPIVKPLTKYATRLTIYNFSGLKTILEEAYYQAMTPRQGPVWFDIPLDLQGREIS